MQLSSTEKILSSAKECFFQHGYSAANITMIAKYADISRVTIHKQFTSKEILFRAVVEQYIQENLTLLEQYALSINDFWSDTEDFLLQRCGGLFDEIPSAVIRSDLLHAGQSYCQDIIQENELRVRENIDHRISQELAAKRMTLEHINISQQEFSRVIETAPFGLALSTLNEDNKSYVKSLMKVYKAATTV
ncbi:TetR/AcrR family transcriptional regulator [Colwellia sp. E2M01]|uniref:TetR/AcrR family transcriptional regulator n=1 Tax=Colwellia sp. E2M01 TaxID=2841561 RepID=UPI001C08B3FF|nr:TetR/AcrR family transcriptional regulator [Colwellia sp. E2M01]